MPFDPLRHTAAYQRGTDGHAFVSMCRVYPLHVVRGWEAAFLPVPSTSDYSLGECYHLDHAMTMASTGIRLLLSR